MLAFLFFCFVVVVWLQFRRVTAAVDGLSQRVAELEFGGSPLAPPQPAHHTPRVPTVPEPVVVKPPTPVPPVPAPVATTFAPTVARTDRPVAPVAPVAPETLESRIGSKWLLYIGVIAIVIGATYFIKLAFDNQWITPGMRVVMGGILGAALAYAGTRFVRAGYPLYGQMISGGGIAVLYVSTYAAFNYYHLVPQPAAFAMMCGVTLVGATLADRQRSQGLALMAVGGGFATPFLLPGDANAQVALFTYDAIIVAGTMYLAGRRDWPLLNLLSYVAVGLTVGAWAAEYYTPARYLTTEIFLTIFCAMFLYILHATRRSERALAETVRMVLWSAPAAYYAASLAVLSEHSVALLVFLLAVSLAGSILAHATRSSIVRAVFWAAAIVPLSGWIHQHAGSAWLIPGLVTVAAVYALTLLSQFVAVTGDDASWNDADIALLHGNALFTAFAIYLLVDAVRSDLAAPVIAGFAVWQALLTAILSRRDRRVAVHLGALAFTLLAAATGLQFHGAALTAAWAGEGCAVIWLGLRERRAWLRLGGALGFVVALGRLGVLLSAPPLAAQRMLLNERTACGLFIIALTYGLAWMHHRRRDQLGRTIEVAVALVGAALLILAVACAEIAAYWSIHPAAGFGEKSSFITAFALAGVSIVWLGLHRREDFVRLVGGLCLVEAALLLLAIQFDPAGAGYRVVVNSRAAAGILVVGACYALAWLHKRLGAHMVARETQIGGLLIVANLLTLSLLTSEINAYWQASGELTASMARDALQVAAWTAVGTLLAWMGIARRATWTRLIGGAILGIAVLMLLQLEFTIAPAGYVVIANPRLAATAIVIAALYWLAGAWGDPGKPDGAAVRTTLVLLANGLTLVFLTSEITAFWQVHDAEHLGRTESLLARGATLSLAWAAYATAAIVVGIRRRYAPIRYFAMVVFAITILKVFVVDMAELERVYRIVSVIGLGVMLLATSYLYQRFKDVPA